MAILCQSSKQRVEWRCGCFAFLVMCATVVLAEVGGEWISTDVVATHPTTPPLPARTALFAGASPFGVARTSSRVAGAAGVSVVERDLNSFSPSSSDGAVWLLTSTTMSPTSTSTTTTTTTTTTANPTTSTSTYPPKSSSKPITTTSSTTSTAVPTATSLPPTSTTTTTRAPPPPRTLTSPSSLSSGVVVGAVVGSVMGALIMGVAVALMCTFCTCCRRCGGGCRAGLRDGNSDESIAAEADTIRRSFSTKPRTDASVASSCAASSDSSRTATDSRTSCAESTTSSETGNDEATVSSVDEWEGLDEDGGAAVSSARGGGGHDACDTHATAQLQRCTSLHEVNVPALLLYESAESQGQRVADIDDRSGRFSGNPSFSGTDRSVLTEANVQQLYDDEEARLHAVDSIRYHQSQGMSEDESVLLHLYRHKATSDPAFGTFLDGADDLGSD